MACSACEKSRLARLQQQQKQATPVVTPINELIPEGNIVSPQTPQVQNTPSDKFQKVKVLPPQRG